VSGGTAESAHITVTITGQQQTSEEGTAVEASPTATTTRPPNAHVHPHAKDTDRHTKPHADFGGIC